MRYRRILAATIVAGGVIVPTQPVAAIPTQPIGSIELDQDSNDLAYDPHTDRLFVSVGSDAATNRDSVLVIDDATGETAAVVAVGANPNRLSVSDGGEYLYVGVDGEHAVKRVNLVSLAVDRTWALPPSAYGAPEVAIDLEAQPGTPTAVAVVVGHLTMSSMVVVLDESGQRPVVMGDGPGTLYLPYRTPPKIAFSTDVPSRLYGYEPGLTGNPLYRMDVLDDGVHLVDVRSDVMHGNTWDIDYDNGLLTGGKDVIDPESGSVVTTTDLHGPYHVVLDGASGRVFSADQQKGGIVGTAVLDVYAFGSTSPVDRFVIGAFDGWGWDSADLVATGPGEFAFAAGTSLFLIAPGSYRGSAGEYTSLTPSRVLDTRTGLGADGVVGPVGPGGMREVQIAGLGGVPASGADSVVLNATAAAPTERSYLTVWPTGAPMPDSSNLNYAPGETRANLVTVPIGADGKVSLFNERGDTHVIFDVVGFYATADGPAGSRFRPLSPSRLFDTRGGAPVGPGGTYRFDVTGVGGVPDGGVTAVAINVTAVHATANSYVTVWPDDVGRPNASNLNFPAGGTVPNLVIMRVPASGIVSFFNESGDVHLLADVVGYYTADRSVEGGRFVSFWPSRFLDTRLGSGGPLVPGDIVYFDGQDEPYAAYVLNVTVTETLGAGYVTVHPWPGNPPNASNLNYTSDVSVPNAVIVPTGPGIAFSNFTGVAHLIADVFGAFTKA